MSLAPKCEGERAIAREPQISKTRTHYAAPGRPQPTLAHHGYHPPVIDAALVACPHCDLLQRLPQLSLGASARCPRCDKELSRHRPDSLQRTLALTLAAAICLLIANSVPLLGLSVLGLEVSTSVFGGARQLWTDGQQPVAALVLFTSILAPALQIGMLLVILLGALSQRPPRWVGSLLRLQPKVSTWSTIEVLILGVLVALIKIADYATVIPGIALFTLGALVVLLAAIQSTFDPQDVWRRVEWAKPHARSEVRA
jgi:paraquat-inducible protein A